MKNRLIVIGCVILTALAIIFGYKIYTTPEGSDCAYSSTLDILAEPVQKTNSEAFIPILELGSKKYTIIPVADYRIAGIVVSKKKYYNGFMSELSPYDFALIWGKAPDYLPYIKFDQVVRFCLYKYQNNAPIDVKYLNAHFSNNHLIPADKNIKRALGKVQKKDKVQLEGYLVNVLGQDQKKRFSSWNTSKTRIDEGNGACEIIYVTRLRINNKEYI
ncbi:MAG: hypothetical protein ABFC98_04050 [Candidatus Cloacimonas sp.]